MQSLQAENSALVMIELIPYQPGRLVERIVYCFTEQAFWRDLVNFCTQPGFKFFEDGVCTAFLCIILQVTAPVFELIS